MDGTLADRIPDVRYPDGWNVGGQDSGCEISGEGGTSVGSRCGGMSADRIPDVRYPGGLNVGGQDSECEISGWMERWRTGFRM